MAKDPAFEQEIQIRERTNTVRVIFDAIERDVITRDEARQALRKLYPDVLPPKTLDPLDRCAS